MKGPIDLLERVTGSRSWFIGVYSILFSFVLVGATLAVIGHQAGKKMEGIKREVIISSDSAQAGLARVQRQLISANEDMLESQRKILANQNWILSRARKVRREVQVLGSTVESVAVAVDSVATAVDSMATAVDSVGLSIDSVQSTLPPPKKGKKDRR